MPTPGYLHFPTHPCNVVRRRAVRSNATKKIQIYRCPCTHGMDYNGRNHELCKYCIHPRSLTLAFLHAITFTRWVNWHGTWLIMSPSIRVHLQFGSDWSSTTWERQTPPYLIDDVFHHHRGRCRFRHRLQAPA